MRAQVQRVPRAVNLILLVHCDEGAATTAGGSIHCVNLHTSTDSGVALNNVNIPCYNT